MSDQDILDSRVRVPVRSFERPGRARVGIAWMVRLLEGEVHVVFFVTPEPVKAAYVPPLWGIKPFVVLCFLSKSGCDSAFTRFFFFYSWTR